MSLESEELASARDRFIAAACISPTENHTSGSLDQAVALLAQHPEIASSDIHTAAILGDAVAVQRFLDADAERATEKGGPHGWDALTHLCFSRYLRSDHAQSDGFVRAAQALLDAGANANTGWFEPSHSPSPTWESAIYGVAGIAKRADLTRVLLEHGADPNDDETPYHSPEGYDNSAVEVLLESGKLTKESLSMMLLRKTDWHDYDGIKLLLDHGVDVNAMTRWEKTALHNAILSDNDVEILTLLLDRGADPSLVANQPLRGRPGGEPKSATAMAAHRGRGDFLDLLHERGIHVAMTGADRLLAACAQGDSYAVGGLALDDKSALEYVRANGGSLLGLFAGNGNAKGLRELLTLKVPVDERFLHGDGYFGTAPNGTALHSAAWRGRHEAVAFLVEKGADVNARNWPNETPLMLAVKACVDSYWSWRRKPDSVRTLLEAGASTAGVKYPSGYVEIDELIGAARAHNQ